MGLVTDAWGTLVQFSLGIVPGFPKGTRATVARGGDSAWRRKHAVKDRKNPGARAAYDRKVRGGPVDAVYPDISGDVWSGRLPRQPRRRVRGSLPGFLDLSGQGGSSGAASARESAAAVVSPLVPSGRRSSCGGRECVPDAGSDPKTSLSLRAR